MNITTYCCGIDHFDKNFDKDTRKRGLARKHFGVFSPRYSYSCTLNGEFHSKMDTIRAFLSKIRILFFPFSKKAGESSPLLLSCVPVSVADYASISLNMPENP